MTDFAVLRLIGMKGRVGPDAISESLGRPVGDECQQLVDSGLAKETPAGLRLTPEGRTRVAELVADEHASVDRAAVGAAYEEFDAFNGELKSIVTAWQMRDTDTPNDHTDTDYDAGVLGRLRDLHARFRPLAARLAALVARLAPYPARFDTADARVAAGDVAYVARPIIDSYHTVWFELHEDLIGLAGLTRAGEAAAGRGA